MSFYLTEFTREETSWQVAYLTCYLGCWASSPTFWNNIDFLPPGLPFLPQCPSFNSQVKCSQYESGTEGCKWKTQVLNEFAMGLFLKEGRKSSCLLMPPPFHKARPGKQLWMGTVHFWDPTTSSLLESQVFEGRERTGHRCPQGLETLLARTKDSSYLLEKDWSDYWSRLFCF